MSMMITTLEIFSKSAMNIYQRFLDAVINILYTLSFSQLFVLDLLKVQLKQIKHCKSFY